MTSTGMLRGPIDVIWKGLHNRAVRHGLVLAGLANLCYHFFVLVPRGGTLGGDAFAYWAVNLANPYRLPNGTVGAFLYPPPAAQLFEPAGAIDWPDFWLIWSAVLLATAIWLGGRSAVVLAFPPVAIELQYGNVNLLIAAAIALGFRYPAAWSFVLLTKVTPGIGLLWFVVRREWRRLAIAVGATAGIVAASLVVDSGLWPDWISAMQDNGAQTVSGPWAIPLPLRLVVAAVVVIWGARTDRRWTVPVGATLSLPVLWPAGLSILAAIACLDRPQLKGPT